MRIAVIGLGDIATKAYLPILTQMEGIELVLCTRHEQVLTQLARKYRINAYCTDYRQLLNLNIDAVMIHSATSTHFDIASFFLNHAIATFVDKPLADNFQHVEKLYELAEKNASPLYIGFNRRHIPLFNQHLPNLQQGQVQDILSFRWEKNRYQLPGDLNTFVFDDFIHPLDSVNVTAKSSLEEVHVVAQRQGKQLARLDVQWQQGQSIFHASMNRQFGNTTERVQVCLENKTYEFDSFVSGVLLTNEEQCKIAEKDWTPMLMGKGFHSMLEDWFNVVRANKLASHTIDRNLASHQLAEQLYQKIKKEITH
ncbi:Gfo/Idh/MocA family oxidoreductase [Vibrio sp. 404]|uniref:Gfo/Idh/MocA family oxidoreductase n=1 Tax=Vibrio marinisediminis TaxID=2758441 RepID=A0A7W2IVL4_9VIBR|nr:Gfo/Idh/MocA family oxidoreductase [Vibrio marinisediminis]MBA5764574.1 Gfo/Idh/MocA family oxidoreductase [Vibrio marinisediminis]